MKILLVHNKYKIIGGEDIVFANESKLLKSQHNQVFEYLRDNKEIGHSIKSISNPFWNEREKGRISKIVLTEKIDIVHFHNIFPLLTPSVYYCSAKNPPIIIQTLHNYRLLCPNALFLRNNSPCEKCKGKLLAWPGIIFRCYRVSFILSLINAFIISFHKILQTWQNKITIYIALSEFSRNKFIEGGIPSEKIIVKPNFIVSDPGEKSFIGDNALFVGRLSEEKGLLFILDSWGKVSIPLKIIGDGPLFSRILSESSLLQNVEIAGKKDHDTVIAYMKNARYLIFPSLCYENFPLTIVEAYACGTPVIASKIGAVKELVKDMKTGILFEPGNSDDFIEKVSWAWTHPEEMAKMGKNARAEYEAKYTAEKNYEMLMGIYQKAIENHNARNEQKRIKWSISRLFSARKNHKPG